MSDVEFTEVVPTPDAGRPKVAALTSRRQGSLDIHLSRDGSLWLFAVGPSGGNRGELHFRIADAPDLLKWMEAPDRLLPAGHAWIKLEDDDTLIVGIPGHKRKWRLDLNHDAVIGFNRFIHAWATAARDTS